MIIKMAAFWDLALCSLAEVDQRFRYGYCLHHQDGAISQKDTISITAAVRT
jgi:hypothetical protein